MKTLHLAIIVGSGIAVSGIAGIMIMSGILDITGQNFNSTKSHGLPELSYFTLFFNGSSDSLSPIQFEARQGQNITLVVNVTSTPENLPMTLYTEPHIGFTTTNGMDLKLSSTHVTTPGTVLLHIYIGNDATPNQYRTRVFATNMNDTLGIDVGITVKPQNSTERFSVTGSKITHYYDGSTIKPKVELYDYYYNGIDKDNTTVSINNQTYYQTTLNYADYDLKKRTSIQFQNVTFAFPEGVMTTPGGAFIMLDIKFSDGSEEIYGENKKNPDGSGVLGGIGIPTSYGPHSSTNSTTVLGNHVMPQAGMTIYNDKMKLLVSK